MGAVSSRRDEEPEVVVLAAVGDGQSVMAVLVGAGDDEGVFRDLGLAQDAHVRDGGSYPSDDAEDAPQDAHVRDGDVVTAGGGDGVVAKWAAAAGAAR